MSTSTDGVPIPSENTKIKTTSQNPPADELNYWSNILKGEYMGIDFETMKAYIGNQSWELKPYAHTKKHLEKISASLNLHKKAIDAFKAAEISEDELLKSTNKTAKENLELSLIGFIYEDAANDSELGPKVLADLSGMLKDFLVYVGGSPGVKRLRQQSQQMTRLGSPTSPS